MEFNYTTVSASTRASHLLHFLLYRYLLQGQYTFIYTCVGGMQTAIINYYYINMQKFTNQFKTMTSKPTFNKSLFDHLVT